MGNNITSKRQSHTPVAVREIKFRAWDTVRKKMWTPTEMGADEVTINPDGRGFVNVSDVHPKLSQYMAHMIPLQYTGLKDSNGKEIYEGDIVKTIYNTIGEITFEQCPGRIAEDGHFYGSPIYGWNIKEKNSNRCFNTVLEVIGNIYENPELLEE